MKYITSTQSTTSVALMLLFKAELIALLKEKNEKTIWRRSPLCGKK